MFAAVVGVSGAAVADSGAKSADCTEKALAAARADAKVQIGQGNYAAALQTMERVLVCKSSELVADESTAYVAACGAKNEKRAKELFKDLVARGKDRSIRQICLKDGIDPEK